MSDLSASPRGDATTSRNHGRFVVVVGPDGAGKTTLARALLDHPDVDGGYFHFIPSPRAGLDGEPPPDPGLIDKPRESGTTVLGLARMTRNLVRAWLGYLFSIRPAVRSGKTVVGDRWLFGYIAQPEALRFYGPRWAARVVQRVSPQPDLVVLLEAPPPVIRRRKPELTVDEIEREARRWRTLGGRVLPLDATEGPEVLSRQVVAQLWPSTGLVRYPPTLGHVLLPTTTRRSSLAATSLYAPSRRRSIAAHGVLRRVVGTIGARWLPSIGTDQFPLDPAPWAELVHALRGHGLTVSEVALYTRTQEARGGLALLVLDDGRPVAFVRVGPADSVDRECRALTLLEEAGPASFRAPVVLARGAAGHLDYAVHSPVLDGVHRPAVDAPIGEIVEEVQQVLQGLPKPPGMPAHWRPIHGDLAPWNLRSQPGADRPALVDWESAGWGPPRADEVLFRATCAALGLAGPVAGLDDEAVGFWSERIGHGDDERDAAFVTDLLRTFGDLPAGRGDLTS